MVNAGRILILAKGAWSATTNYTQLDLVSYNSIAYLARQASVGVNPAQDTQMSYWMPFGSAASIATTSTPGLVMPDGTTITITNTGLIKAVLGVNDISDVVITSPTNGQVLKYNSATQKWENGSLGTAANKDATNTISSGSTDLIESGAVHSAIQTLTNTVNGKVNTSDIANNLTTTASGKVLDARQGKALNDKIKNKVLYLTEIACSATTGNFVSYSNSAITADHVVAECVFANPSAITSNVTWTTANGSLTLNGTCSTATTVNVVLVKKDN